MKKQSKLLMSGIVTILVSNSCLGLTSINKAIGHALRERSDLKAASKKTISQKYTALSELSGYFPHFFIDPKFTNSREGIYPKKQLIFGFNQLLLSFSGPLQRYRIEKHNTEINRLIELFKQDAITFEAEESFLNFWKVQQKKKALDRLEIATKSQFKKAIHQNLLQLLDKNIWLNEVAQNTANIETINQYNDEIMRAGYTFQTAIESKDIICPDPHSAHIFVSRTLEAAKNRTLNHYLEAARQHRKELFIKDEEIKRNNRISKFHRNFYLPTVSFFVDALNLSTGANTVLTPAIGTKEKFFWRYGIFIHWEFDGLKNAFQSESASVDELVATLEKLRIERDIKLEVKTTYHETQELLKQLRAAQSRLDQQRNEFKLRKIQRDIGEISNVTWLQAEQEWEQAQFDFESLRIDTARNQRKLLYKCGYPPNS